MYNKNRNLICIYYSELALVRDGSHFIVATTQLYLHTVTQHNYIIYLHTVRTTIDIVH